MRHLSTLPRIAVLAVSVGALLSAGSALAAQRIYGGGSTFVAPAYLGSGYLNVTPNARLSTNAGNNAGSGFTNSGFTTGSVFSAWSTKSLNKISYCQTGSGFGKNSLNGASTAPANGNCTDFSTSPVGLSAPATATGPDFIGTDAPYSTTDYNAFLSGTEFAPHQGIVQVPTIAGAIALPSNDAVTNVSLSNAQVCRIYSGMIKNWSQIPGATGTGTSGAITIVYRTDGSGTTFSFTRYLASACNGGPNVPSGFVFTPNSTFNSALPGGTAAVYGTRSIGASGNTGVVSTTLNASNPGALGYADIGEVINEGAGYALVAGFDAAKFGKDSLGNPVPVSITPANLLTGKVLDGATVNPVPGSSSQTIKNCVRVVNPTVRFNNTYPIVAVTYLDAYYTGNGLAGHKLAIRDMFNFFYDQTNRPKLPTGYAYLDGLSTFATTVKNTITACFK